MSIHEEKHAAAADACQPNFVRETIQGDTGPKGFCDVPAICPLSEKRGEIIGLELALSLPENEEKDDLPDEAHLFSVEKTSALLPGAVCPLPDWLKGFVLSLRDGLKVCPRRPVCRDCPRSGGQEPALRPERVSPALFARRNLAFVFSMIGVAIIMVKLLSGGVKPARQHGKLRSGPAV